MTLARVRIHADAMSSSDILDNYNLEKNDFTVGTPVPLATGPAHRYSFDNPAGAAPDGSSSSTPSAAEWPRERRRRFLQRLRLTLSGGANTTASYVDLPNGLLSTNSADNGGSGQVTLEGWVKITGGRTWARIFDIGSSDIGGGVGGEVTGPGGGGALGLSVLQRPGRGRHQHTSLRNAE